MTLNAQRSKHQNPNTYFQTAEEFKNQGEWDQAIQNYQQAIRLKPNYLEAYYRMADAYQHKKEFSKAVTAYEKAIQLAPGAVDLYGCLASALCFGGRIEEAVKVCEQAIALDSTNATTYFSLSNVYIAIGNLDQALMCCAKALELQPQFAPVFHNVGQIYLLKQDLVNAENNFLSAVEINPNLLESWVALSDIYAAHLQVNEAITVTRKALQLNFNQPQLHYRLGTLLMREDKKAEAVPYLRAAIHLTEDAPRVYWYHLAECLQGLNFEKIDDLMRSDLLRMLELNYIDTGKLVDLLLSAVHQDTAFLQSYNLMLPHLTNVDSLSALIEEGKLDGFLNNPLFLKILKVLTIKSPLYETIFANLRKVFLTYAMNNKAESLTRTPVKRFISALAVQCFFNEFVYGRTEEEDAFIEGELAQTVNKVIQTPYHSRTAYQNTLAALFGCYEPLLKVEGSEKLIEGKLPQGLEDALIQQIYYPLQEKEIRKEIPALTPISEGVSQAVQNMYEENPYPRWVNASVTPISFEPKSFFEHTVSFFKDKELCFENPLRMLIAGCGSGKHPIQSGSFFANAEVVALDLSLTSLAYAIRKTKELGLTNVKYAQADIMQLEGRLEDQFDIIESAGVLHHLEDPMAGWKILVGFLKPKGVMRIGLYSETARRHIVATRAHIKELNFASTPKDIRRLRQIVLNGTTDPLLQKAASNGDFYTLSECRDLLFHVQEHRFSIPKIKECLAELGLEFAGFDIPNEMVEKYKAQFPDDTDRVNLDNWAIFESENPDMFMTMYQFWAYKPA